MIGDLITKMMEYDGIRIQTTETIQFMYGCKPSFNRHNLTCGHKLSKSLCSKTFHISRSGLNEVALLHAGINIGSTQCQGRWPTMQKQQLSLDKWNTTPHQLAGCTRRSSGLDSNALSSRCQTASQIIIQQQIWGQGALTKKWNQAWRPPWIQGMLIGSLAVLCVSKKRGRYPQIIHFNRVFHYKPSILGYPYFWKHPCTQGGNST